MRLKLGEKKASSVENLQTLMLVVNTALNGYKPKPKPVQNFDQASKQFSAIFGNNSTFKAPKNVFDGLDGVFEKLEKTDGK